MVITRRPPGVVGLIPSLMLTRLAPLWAKRSSISMSTSRVRRRKYAKRFHLLAAWKYGIMLEPERLSWEPTPVRRGYTSSRSGY